MKQTIGNTYVISLEKCTVIFPGIQSQLVVMIHTGGERMFQSIKAGFVVQAKLWAIGLSLKHLVL